MKVTSRTIIGMILALVFIMVLFNMLPTILPSVITSVNSLFNTTNLGNSATTGAGAAAFSANVSTYLGWFWVNLDNSKVSKAM